MQEKWPDRPALPAVDFRKDLLQPVNLKPNPVPRYKRVPVAKPELCADVADHIFEMCYQQEVRDLARVAFSLKLYHLII